MTPTVSVSFLCIPSLSLYVVAAGNQTSKQRPSQKKNEGKEEIGINVSYLIR